MHFTEHLHIRTFENVDTLTYLALEFILKNHWKRALPYIVRLLKVLNGLLPDLYSQYYTVSCYCSPVYCREIKYFLHFTTHLWFRSFLILISRQSTKIVITPRKEQKNLELIKLIEIQE